jgi:hypothetical protein
MSYLEARTDIISIPQQAVPKVIGHKEFLRAQLMMKSVTDVSVLPGVYFSIPI